MLGKPEFYREDLTKYENRINLCFFGCMLSDQFRERIFKRLRLGKDLWLQPEHVEHESLRPDFAVYSGEERIAYLEVELDNRDKQQERNYTKNLKEPVRWIVGQPNTYGDLSLTEIVEFAAEVISMTPDLQAKANLRVLQLVIKDGLTQAKTPRPVSRDLPNWFLSHHAFAVIERTLRPIMGDDGQIQNWTTTQDGVSLRLVGVSQDVDAGRLGFALVTVGSRDTNTILVPTRAEIEKRLHGRLEKWGRHFADLIDRMLEGSIRQPRGNGRERLLVEAFDQHENEVADLFMALVSALKQPPI